MEGGGVPEPPPLLCKDRKEGGFGNPPPLCDVIGPGSRALTQLARLVKMVRGPWVIGGGWNLAPEALAEAGWVGEVEGRIVATKAPTCGASRLDYFVLSRQLGQGVAYIKRLTGFGIAPHHPIRLALKAGLRRLLVRAMVAPMKVPADLPQGCLEERHYRVVARDVAGEQGGSGEAPTLVGRIRRWHEDAEEVWADIGGERG